MLGIPSIADRGRTAMAIQYGKDGVAARAKSYNVSTATVAKALRVLRDEGLIGAAYGGTFVPVMPVTLG